jgi:hypothetical protein
MSRETRRLFTRFRVLSVAALLFAMLTAALIARRRVRRHAWIPALYTASAAAASSIEQQAPWSMLQGFGFLAVTTALLRVGVRAALTRAREAHQRLSPADRDGSVAP